MAAYPNIPLRRTFRSHGGTRLYYSDDGTLRGVNTESVNPVEITIIHPLVDLATVNQVLDFYDANRGDTVTWTDPVTGKNYQGIIPQRPVEEHVKGPYWNIKTILRGNPV
jgi:hypothetical protein